MPVFHLNDLPKQKRIQMIAEFYDIIDSLKDRNEVRLFFKSLLGPEEIAMLMRRIEIAVLLSANFNYDQIIKMLGVGSNKITNVQKSLQQDDNGYKLIVKRLIENRKQRLRKIKKENKEKIDMSPLALAKKKYAGHFLLPNLLDAAIEKLEEDDKSLEKEALLFTPSSTFLRKK
jgi:TrpR-related protein YerC/YecD